MTPNKDQNEQAREDVRADGGLPESHPATPDKPLPDSWMEIKCRLRACLDKDSFWRNWPRIQAALAAERTTAAAREQALQAHADQLEDAVWMAVNSGAESEKELKAQIEALQAEVDGLKASVSGLGFLAGECQHKAEEAEARFQEQLAREPYIDEYEAMQRERDEAISKLGAARLEGLREGFIAGYIWGRPFDESEPSGRRAFTAYLASRPQEQKS